MNINRLEKILVFVIKTLSFGVLITPLLPAILFQVFLFPHAFGKMIFAQGLIGVILTLYLILCFFCAEYRPKLFFSSKNRIRKKYNWVLIIATLFVLALGITTFFSIDPSVSFWGTLGWNNGLLTILYCFSFFIVLLSLLPERKFLKNFLKINFYVGVPIILYGLAEYMGFFGLQVGEGRAISTLGNAIYFSSYTIFPIFASFALGSLEKRTKKRYLYLVIGILEIVMVIISSQTRAFIIGLVISFITVISIYGFFRLNKTWKKTFIVTSFLLLAIVVIGVWQGLNSGSVYRYANRYQTIKTRIVAWQIAWQGVKEKPLIGWGIENFNAPFEKYFDYNFYTPNADGTLSEPGVDFPHNKILEVAVSNGIFSVTLYLALFIVLFSALVFYYKKTRRIFFLAILGLFVAYFVQNLFAFDSFVSYLLFFSFLSIVGSLDIVDYEGRTLFKKINIMFLTIFSITIMGLSVFLFYFVTIKPIIANYWASKSYSAYTQNNYNLSLSYLKNMDNLGIDFVSDRLNMQLASSVSSRLAGASQISPEEEIYVIDITSRLEKMISKRPYRIDNYTLLGRLYIILGYKDKEYAIKGLAISDKAFEAGSRRLQTYNNKAVSFFQLGQKEEGLSILDQAIVLKPDYGLPYTLKAQAHLSFGEKDLVLINLEKAFALGYIKRSNLEVYAQILFDYGKNNEAIEALTKIVDLSGSDAKSLYYLADGYKRIGDKEKAKIIIENMTEKFPEYKVQGDIFLQALEKESRTKK
ncbi:O-antigen ligase family protein [Candidatus Microgenomates bacterium]|nr:O-antigen ligase family protein [Candidatus Microgenomates bacterium]